jgi:hypothetical protein
LLNNLPPQKSSKRPHTASHCRDACKIATAACVRWCRLVGGCYSLYFPNTCRNSAIAGRPTCHIVMLSKPTAPPPRLRGCSIDRSSPNTRKHICTKTQAVKATPHPEVISRILELWWPKWHYFHFSSSLYFFSPYVSILLLLCADLSLGAGTLGPFDASVPRDSVSLSLSSFHQCSTLSCHQMLYKGPI